MAENRRPDPILWINVIVRYCPRCRRVHPPDAERCERCGGLLIDQVRREPVEDR